MSCKLFVNGDILTMEDNLYADAVFIKNGTIKAVGNQSVLKHFADKNTEIIDLGGKTLIPSFIDTHSHLSAYAQSLIAADLSKCKSYFDIVTTIKDYVQKHPPEEGEPIIAFGYDHIGFQEKSHPTRHVLDKAFEDIPIIASHKSGHMGVLNTIALKMFGITAETSNPRGGKIGRERDNTPSGYLEESIFIEIAGKAAQTPLSKKAKFIEKAQKIYASYGITTASEGLMTKNEMEALINSTLTLDVCGYVDLNREPQLLYENVDKFGKYIDNFKISGYKIILDGSPQSKTAWITFSYKDEIDYSGYSQFLDPKVISFIEKAVKEKRQIAVHCNGDAAADQFIRCYEAVLRENGGKSKIRPIMIHAQILRDDQLQKMKQLNIIPSFFVSHTYYFGDLHLQNLGKRAMEISPCKSAADLDMPFTIHQDTPVLEPDMIKAVSCAVNRVTEQGIRLAREQCISPLDALKAVTIHAAHQYFEEDKKGSIASGKYADFVILSDNPLKVSHHEIENIKVVETIKRGNTIFKQ